MGMTFAEKVLAKKAGLDKVVPGQLVSIKPDRLLTHDNTAAIISKITKELDEYGLYSNEVPAIVIDHVVPAADEKTATNHKKIRAFVKKHDIKHFYDAGEGVCHQVLFEKGLVRPGMVAVGSDSHTCSYGALGAFATGIDRTEAACLLLMGETWFRVPPTIKITLNGELPENVTAKDLILTIIGDLGADGAGYQAVEFHGDIENLTMDERFTIANMGIEMGAKIAVFPVDKVTEEFMASHKSDIEGEILSASQFKDELWADEDATYIKELEYDLSIRVPQVACPHAVDNVKPAKDLGHIEIHQCLIGTCTNGRTSDFKAAAKVLKGKKIAPSVRLLILPASRTVMMEAMAKGYITILLEAGAMLLPAGCGPCLGAHQGCLAPEEKCISTANRNFKGRMGCKDAEIYLASPETVATSALTGKITDPRDVR